MASAENIPPGQGPGPTPQGFVSPSGQQYPTQPAPAGKGPAGKKPGRARRRARQRPGRAPAPHRQRQAPAAAPASGIPSATPSPASQSSTGKADKAPIFFGAAGPVQDIGPQPQPVNPVGPVAPGVGMGGPNAPGALPQAPGAPGAGPVPLAGPAPAPAAIGGQLGGAPAGAGAPPVRLLPAGPQPPAIPPEPTPATCPAPLTTCDPCPVATVAGDGSPTDQSAYADTYYAPAVYDSGAVGTAPQPEQPAGAPEPSAAPASSPSSGAQCCSMPADMLDALQQAQTSGQTMMQAALEALQTVAQSLDNHFAELLSQSERTIGACNGSCCGQMDRALNQCQGTLDKCTDKIYTQLANLLGESLASLAALGYRIEVPAAEQPIPAAPMPIAGPIAPEVVPAIIGGAAGPVNVQGGITIAIPGTGGTQAVYVNVNCKADATAIANAVANAIVQAVPGMQAPPAPQPIQKPGEQNVQVTQSVSEAPACCTPPLVRSPGPDTPDRYKLPVAARSLFQFVSGPDIIIQSPDTWSVRPGEVIAIVDTDGHTVAP